MMVRVGIQAPTRAKAGSKMDQIVESDLHRSKKEYRQELCAACCSAGLTKYITRTINIIGTLREETFSQLLVF